MDKSQSKYIKLTIGHVIGLAVGLTIAFYQPPVGLTHQAMQVMGILAWAICAWVFELFPDYVVALIMSTSWVAAGSVPFDIVFSTFASSNWWLMLGALGMGVAATRSGLLQRLSLKVLQVFPFTYVGQILGMLVSGLIIAPLIPSITSKVAITAPFARALSDNVGFEPRGKGAAGIFAAMFTGCGCTGPMFLSASYMGYVLLGILPGKIQHHFSWLQWFLAALPWGITLLLASLAAILLVYRARLPENSRDTVHQQLRELDPMSRKEKITIAVLLIALLAWISEPLHHIPAVVVALLALCILLGVEVFDRSDFRQLIPWDALILIGGIIGMGPVLSALNIDKWLGQYLSAFIVPYAGNIYAFTFILSVVIYLVRFVLVSQLVCITLFTVLLTPLAL
ncbi:MAG: SLC13 family permease, partial [Ignavibacteriales bacterium]